MKRFRGKIAAVLTVILILTLAAPVTAKQYTDVTRSGLGTEKLDAINFVTDHGIMNGLTEDTFGPSKTLTRGMFVTILYRFSGESTNGKVYTNPFTDVPSGTYYTNAVGWAYYHGIVNGVTTTTFAPSHALTREQTLTFLHRFATSYRGESFSVSNQLGRYTDGATVSNFAKTAVSWAIQYRVYRPSTYIYPKTQISRVSAALNISDYAWMIDRITKTDMYSFGNTTSAFGVSTYTMSDTHYNMLLAAVEAYYGKGSSGYILTEREFRRLRGSPWEGCCFGMSATVALQKRGKIDFCRYFGNKTSFSKLSIKTNSRLQDAITYYHFTQLIPIFKDVTVYTTVTSGNTLEKGVSVLKDTLDQSGPVLIGFKGYIDYDHSKPFGHAVLVYDHFYDTKHGRDVFLAYDPNTPGAEKQLYVKNTTIYYNDDPAIELMLYKNLNNFDYFDMDGDTNDFGLPWPPFGVSPSENREPTVSLLVAETGNVVIRNGKGETYSLQDGLWSGDLEGIREWPIFFETPLRMIELPYTEGLEVLVSGERADLSLAGNGLYCAVTGEHVESIRVDFASRELQVRGNEAAYEATVDASDSQDQSCCVSVSGSGTTSFQVAANAISIQSEATVLQAECEGQAGSTPLEIQSAGDGFQIYFGS